MAIVCENSKCDLQAEVIVLSYYNETTKAQLSCRFFGKKSCVLQRSVTWLQFAMQMGLYSERVELLCASQREFQNYTHIKICSLFHFTHVCCEACERETHPLLQRKQVLLESCLHPTKALLNVLAGQIGPAKSIYFMI